MLGETLMEDFESMDTESKSNILAQTADILDCFQRFELPESIDQYGGLGFDAGGQRVSSALSNFDAGPFGTYEELVRATIESKLERADADSRVKGWRDNNIRTRLNDFLKHGLPDLLKDMRLPKKVLVHADFVCICLLWAAFLQCS